MATATPPGKTSKLCPICDELAIARYTPFCSKRCADVDLNRWLTGSYAVPGADDAEEDGAQSFSYGLDDDGPPTPLGTRRLDD
ncbi:MAG: DNA gyrase inhibitor YacG [Pseudomonadota bacterium]